MTEPDAGEAATTIARWATGHMDTVPAVLLAVPRTARYPVAAPALLASFDETGVIDAGHRVNAVSWTRHPDGRLLLATAGGSAGGDDVRARIWDYRTGQLTCEFSAATEPVSGCSWGQRSDGTPLLAAASGPAALIWDPDTGETLHDLAVPPHPVWTVSFGCQPDGRPLLATASADSSVRVWDGATGDLLHALDVPDVRAATWGYRPDGELLLATCAVDGTMAIWDHEAAEAVYAAEPGNPGPAARSLAWGYRPGGQPLLAGGSEDAPAGGIPVWTVEGAHLTTDVLPSPADGPLAVSWAPLADGRTLLAAFHGRTLQLWDGHALRCRHTEELGYQSGGLHHLDWTLTPDGQLLLAIGAPDGTVHVREAVLDPPVKPPGPASPGSARRARRSARILDPPEDATPGFRSGRALTVDCRADADGRLLLAVNGSAGRVLDLQTGETLGTLSGGRSVAWGDGLGEAGLFAAFAMGGGDIRAYLPGTGEEMQLVGRQLGRQLVSSEWHAGSRWAEAEEKGWTWHPADYVRERGSAPLRQERSVDSIHAIACGNEADGRPLLAASYSQGSVRIWDPGTGTELRSLAGSTRSAAQLALANGPDGGLLLATANGDGSLQSWNPGTGRLLRTFSSRGPAILAVAIGTASDGRLRLAAACDDAAVRIWDADAGTQLRTLSGGEGPVHSLAWENGPQGRSLLVAVGADRTARIWDADAGIEVASVPASSLSAGSAAWVRDAAGDLLLVLADDDHSGGPARVWRVVTEKDEAVPAATAGGPARPGYRPAELADWLLRLGGAGLWLPLGLLTSLIALTGQPESRPGDTEAPAGFAALADEPGITRLRALDWPPDARVAFAALLASGLPWPERYAPPPGTVPVMLREALRRAVAADDGTGPAVPWRVPVPDLRSAAGRITDRVITLLRILGAAACAADPLLPVRLAHRIPQLPALSVHELHLIAAAGPRRPLAGRDTTAGTALHSPGTAGLARTGPLTRLLPTQLALPRDLLTMRLAENQLLYRQHRTLTPPAPEPVTIILDTTPPTFGPAGHALRLAAHLITTILWHHNRHPALISLTDPDTVTELRVTGDLVGLWASTTLARPDPALAIALATAEPVGQPVLFCTHHHTARGTYIPAPATRLLTAHHTPEPPPSAPGSPWHAHLPPGPAQAQLTTAVMRLLMPPRPERERDGG
jgi:WD40 repeat protein